MVFILYTVKKHEVAKASVCVCVYVHAHACVKCRPVFVYAKEDGQ